MLAVAGNDELWSDDRRCSRWKLDDTGRTGDAQGEGIHGHCGDHGSKPLEVQMPNRNQVLNLEIHRPTPERYEGEHGLPGQHCAPSQETKCGRPEKLRRSTISVRGHS